MTSLLPVQDPHVVEWLASRLRRPFSGVASVVPTGYEAYLRIFHPADPGDPRRRRTWAQVAEEHGRFMHALAQFHAISTPAGEQVATSLDAVMDWHNYHPEVGNLPVDQFQRLCQLLSLHTSTTDNVLFGIWDGYAEVLRLLSRQTRLDLPMRSYFVFEGKLGDAGTGWLDWCKQHDLSARSPNLVWPRDRAWCISTEVDFTWTLVGCTRDAANELIRRSGLEVWEVGHEDSLLANGDKINM